MKCTDLTKYGLIFEKPTKLLQNRGILDSDLLDLHDKIASKFISKYCDCGVSLCLYEPFTENPSFYSFLLVKEKSVLQDADVREHESIYKTEDDELWKKLTTLKGREIKEFIYFEKILDIAFKQFCCFIHTSMKVDNTVYYWIKFDEISVSILLVKEYLRKYNIKATNMSSDANILILTAA